MKTCFTLLGSDFVADFDYKVTSRGCPARGPSYSSGGEPAEAVEYEVELNDLREDLPGRTSAPLACPVWLMCLIKDHIQESDDVAREIEEAELEDCGV